MEATPIFCVIMLLSSSSFFFFLASCLARNVSSRLGPLRSLSSRSDMLATSRLPGNSLMNSRRVQKEPIIIELRATTQMTISDQSNFSTTSLTMTVDCGFLSANSYLNGLDFYKLHDIFWR